jgi:hypothetical protein
MLADAVNRQTTVNRRKTLIMPGALPDDHQRAIHVPAVKDTQSLAIHAHRVLVDTGFGTCFGR